MAELNARIACTDETRESLRELTREGERYEDTLVRLLEQHSKALTES